MDVLSHQNRARYIRRLVPSTKEQGNQGVDHLKEVGWLLRTKGKDSNEGGVAAGFSVLDSLVLVD